MKTKLTIHPICNVFPLMEAGEFSALVDDIKANGQREPITVHDGQIIDGRNRYNACIELKLEPRTREWDGKGSLVAFVLSANLHRRHLNASQRAMVAAEIATLERGQKKADASIEASSQDDAAQLLQVGRSSVQRAAKVKKSGAPELVEAVKSGDVPVSVASVIASLPAKKQSRIMEQAKERGGGKPKITAEQVKAMTRERRKAQASGKEYITPGMRKNAQSIFGKLVRILDKMQLSEQVDAHLKAILKAIKEA